MGRGCPDIGGTDGLSGMLKADIADRLMEPAADELVAEGFFFACRQQIGIGISPPQDTAYGQVIGDFGGHRFGYGDQAVFFKLGFFNIKGFVVGPEVMPQKSQGS